MKRIIIISLYCLTGCQTLKTSVKHKEDTKRTAELNTVALKAAKVEREVLTYWSEGNVYRFEQIRAQVDEAQLAGITESETRSSKQSEVLKQRKPMKFWLYMGIGLALIFILWIYRLFKN